MASGGVSKTVMSRLEEARLYHEQGLGEGAVEIITGILNELGQMDLPETERRDLSTLVEKELAKITGSCGAIASSDAETQDLHGTTTVDPSESYQYALALMDGQFWQDAIREFKKAAVVGNQMLECWELAGDCAGKLERWEEAISYYEVVYTQPSVSEDLKRQILGKITKCTQALRKREAKPLAPSNPDVSNRVGESKEVGEPQGDAGQYFISSVTAFDQSPVGRLIGEQIASRPSENGEYFRGEQLFYRVSNVLHVGISSVVVELEEEGSARRYAGQLLNSPFGEAAPAEALARWAYTQSLIDSRYLVTVHDVALVEGQVCFVREHLPLALGDMMGGGEAMPVPLANYLAYQMLIALGDLHLHMGQDERIRRIFHLDLRPSRVLLSNERPRLKINNGGLWRTLEESNPKALAIHRLPLPFLAYRAPEQFRPYLARRKPPVFTDIYLFGTIFYEMLTGVPAFKASSFEEYEIQHCEQYPNPPKVWRRDIPEEVNDLVMKCLEIDPFKRWRSTTELALILEKTFTSSYNPAKDGSYAQFLKNCNQV
ncbi:MAG: protein kinase [Deltaproteobacteria bacterium]|nr:protein kinase [Deltaproteobacteria bacterium]